MPIKNGKQYIERVDRQRIRLWYNGERVNVPLSEHPAFRGLIRTQAAMYDEQCEEHHRDDMTYISPTTGERVGLSFLPPANLADLVRRRKMSEIWANLHHGFLGRSPDYMNTALMSFYTASSALEEYSPEHAQNLRAYYEYCRENDNTLSHAFVQPLASKMSGPADREESLAAKVIDIRPEGLVVSGAFLMATQGPTCEEILVLPTPTFMLGEGPLNPTAFAFAVPNDLEGMTFICRESHAHDSNYDYPLSSRYEEMDTMVIFDRVLVPRERVFYYGEEQLCERLFREGNFHAYAGHHILTRYIAKTEFLLGLLQVLAEEQNMEAEPLFVNQLVKVMAGLENLKALRLAAETGGSYTPSGRYVPALAPLTAAGIQFPDLHEVVMRMIRSMSASQLIMNPFEADFNSENQSYLESYLQGISSAAKDRIALFRLAWELGGGAFGGRQNQFERFFFGNGKTIANRMCECCVGLEDYKSKVLRLIGRGEGTQETML
ncbi:4-hydroxyphenylacetate 3-hydroxylase family protein [Paenibacillus phocaensis]|uniref:4-hydroxyphenylacetate 3-hydroxylase family protein n=1 Tax=Paenibacillus phocaensis TaxID=1776378 RepID=UPI000839BE23|nr:4-hydroxyphenylacetate 3-hydroxylase N-terminal domain-containing protein [Paenibacillus phocaensis]